MNKRVYISGQITGIEVEARELFSNAGTYLMCKGFDVVNPMELTHTNLDCWNTCMAIDIKAMMDCSIVYMLNNWTNSKGAEIERDLAIALGFEVIYQDAADDS